VHQREGLRRDGAFEDGVLQERAASEAPLHEPPHVCLLMHVGAAQARPPLPERQRVRPAAAQVRDACDMMPAFPI
jgi:hypothetical protein